MAKSPDALRTISEVSEDVGVPQHVLRFWETKFTQLKPMKRGGGRRYYRPGDIALIRSINRLLYTDGLTIKGVQKLLRERGVKAIANAEAPLDGSAAPAGSGNGAATEDAQSDLPLNVQVRIAAIRDRLLSAANAAE
ncbi:MerR family transcriptional regulator [Pacificimonas flava]|uniref:MerR family transcriptional regulator n=2 Tax=Pacificimonas TaxID=1960290 RepID=A0A219B4W6_9SPHN|nr:MULTISPECIES: MerR family transcriptional regulator [Pacificimonas]MBZ6377073.1 MerR family transcriptional regulator [Pacificimonas aurantium]OWV33193.1 MerR family transcriptional regulator [Pacificimonas flava]